MYPDLKRALNTPGVEADLLKYLEEKIATYQRMLEQNENVPAIYKAQGSVLILRKLTQIRKELNV